MEDRRVRIERVVEGDQRQLLVLDLDQARGLVRGGLALGGDGGHAISDHPNAVDRQRRPVLQSSTQADEADVGAGQHRVDARHRAGGAACRSRRCAHAGRGLRVYAIQSMPGRRTSAV